MNTVIEWHDADTTEKMGDLYEDFCKSQDLPHATLDQNLATCKAHFEWLDAFSKQYARIERFEADALELSRYMSAIMREALTAQQLDEVNAANAAAEFKDACHSHDIIDANIVAYGAFCSMFFREMDAEIEDDCDLINAAWDIAMRNGYKVKK